MACAVANDIPVAQAFKAEAFPNRTAIFVNGKFQAAYAW
jgi:hypothetical protein